MNELYRMVQRLENGDAWDETDDVVEVEVTRPLEMVIPVRVSAETWEALHQEAHELGVGVGKLIETWVLEKLRALEE
jgi:hypothetical protein